MNGKRILALAGFAALICSTTLTANAATVNKSVTVKWNTQAIATLTLNTNYSAAGAQQNTSPTVLTEAGTGSGTCTAAGGGAEVNQTVNFGNITPDSAVTTDCTYENAINAQVATNSTNWNLTEATATAIPDGAGLCALANNTGKAFPFPVAATLPATQSQWTTTAPYNGTVGTCGTGMALSTTAASVITAENTAFTAGSPANLGEDLQIQIPANAASTALGYSVTVNYSLVAN